MKSFIFSFFFVSLTCSIYAGITTKEIEDKATLLYSEGKYVEALEIWNGLVSSGNMDPNLFFNIGSAESLLGHIPESIMAYEKAARLRPGDNQINEAIKKERAKIDNAVIPVNPFFLIEGYHHFLAIFRPGGWVLIGLLFIVFALWQWLVSMKAIRNYSFFRGRKNWYFTGAGFFFLLLGILSYHRLHRHDEAIIMSACDCRKAASEESPLTRTLSPGEKVLITDHISEWDNVSLLNLDACWIKTGCIKTIEIGSK
jgi:tetratricopeptide (TPR) repeat protein